MTTLLAVVPAAAWTYTEAANLRGSPATHAVVAGTERTLCGRDPEGWQVRDGTEAEVRRLVTCKVCTKALNRGARP